MKQVTNIFSVLFFVAGLFALWRGLAHPEAHSLFSASAVQVTQVYSEASHTLIVAVALFLASGVLQLTNIIRLQSEVLAEAKLSNKALAYLAKKSSR